MTKSQILFDSYRKTLSEIFDRIPDKQWNEEVKTNPHLTSMIEYLEYKRPEKDNH